MKKMICLILAMLMIVSCTGGIAEETGESVFLRIREGATAKVFEAPGGAETADTLDGGSLCGLIGQSTEAGAAWYHVFFLNSSGKGATGYISVEDADALGQKELSALLKDPDAANELLDLIEAMNDYLETLGGAESPETDEDPNKQNNGQKETKKGLKGLYEEAIDTLDKVFSTDVSAELDKITEAGKEAGEKAIEAGKEVLGTLKDQAEDLVSKAGDTVKKELDDNLPKAKEKLSQLAEEISDKAGTIKGETAAETVSNLLDEAAETIEKLKKDSSKESMSQLLDKVSDTIKSLGDKDKITDAKQKMDDALESLNQTAGDTTGSMFDGLSELADKTKEIAEDPIFSVLPGALSGMGEAFRENGFTGGVETVSTLIQLLSSIGGED